MPKPKFDEHDRNKVISEVEKHLSVKLSRVGSYRKFLQDSAGKSYWVFGGYDDWHGIQSDMLQEEQRRSSDGVLVVAKRHRSSIDIFVGQLQPLIDNFRDLSHTKAGGHHFNVAIRGNIMSINELPVLSLRKLGSAQEVGPAVDPHSATSKVEAMLVKLSPAERLRVLEQLKRESEV